MPKSDKFNPARPRVGGISPKDHHTVAPSHLSSGSKKISRKVEELRFQKYCEEVFERNFAEEEVESEAEAREVFENTVREIVADKAFRRIPSTRKILLLTGIAALFATTYLPEVGAGFNDYLTKVAGGALVGGAFGGPLGAIAGAGIASIPAVGASAIPSTSPEARDVKKLSKRSPTKPAEKLMGRYDMEEIVMPKSRIFVSSMEGGDWAFTLGGLQRLGKFISTGVEFSDSQFSMIKNSDLAGAVLDNNFEKFSALITEAAAETEMNFYNTLNSFGQSFAHVGSRRLDKDGMIRELSKRLQKTLDLDLEVVRKAVQNAFDEHFKTGADISSELLHGKLRENLHDEIFSRFKGEAAIRKMFESLKKDPTVKKNDAAYAAAIAEYDKAQRAAARIEIYDDRLQKARLFAADEKSEVITIPKATSAHPFVGYTPYHQRKVLVVVPSRIGKDDRVFFHETLHSFDMERCSLEADGKISYISEAAIKAKHGIPHLEPCGDDKVKDLALNSKLLKAYRRDMARMERIAERGVDSEDLRLDVVNQAVPRFADVNSGGEVQVMEIIPYATDVFGPKTLLHCMPNVAIARTDFIIKTPEAELYAAMLRADLKKVKEIVGKNPAILEETYDTVPLHQIAQVLVDAKFDKYADPKMKTEPKTRYSTLNDYVQKAYRSHSISVAVEADGSTRAA